jgi:hypothetical protein
MNTDSKAIQTFLTICFAAVGAVLGVINTLYNLNQRRLKLKVSPSHLLSPSSERIIHGIAVTNLSTFAVTISEVGMTVRWRHPLKKRAAIIQPMVLDGGKWPRRLEPRESVTLGFDPAGFTGTFGRVYAWTACGEFRYGTSPAFRQLRKSLKTGESAFR